MDIFYGINMLIYIIQITTLLCLGSCLAMSTDEANSLDTSIIETKTAGIPNKHSRKKTKILQGSFVLRQSLPPQMSQKHIDSLSNRYANEKDLKALKNMFEGDQALIPSRVARNGMFRQAANNGSLEFVQFFLSLPEKLTPDRQDIDNAFLNSLNNHHFRISDALIKLEGNLKLYNEVINRGFENAMCHGRLQIVQYLLSLPQGRTPKRRTLDQCLFIAASDEYLNIVDYIFSIPHNRFRPSEDALNRALNRLAQRNLSLNDYPNLKILVEGYRHYTNEDNFAIASEIHNYAETNVSTATSKVALNVAVLNAIEERLNHEVEPIGSVEKLLEKAIIENYSGEESQGNARRAKSHGWIDSTPKALGSVALFLKRYYPDKINLWVQGYLGESMTAYINHDNHMSCVKGVDERILTGLRGVGDLELDALFKQAEQHFFMNKFFSARNVGTEFGSRLIGRELFDQGLTCEASDSELEAALYQNIYAHYASHSIEQTHVVHERIVDEVAVMCEHLNLIRPRIIEAQKNAERRVLIEEQNRVYKLSLEQEQMQLRKKRSHADLNDVSLYADNTQELAAEIAIKGGSSAFVESEPILTCDELRQKRLSFYEPKKEYTLK